MATSYSTNLALALPATGELSGTWGTTVNSNITNMLDEALGYQAYSATGGADTITIPDGTTGVARSIYIQLNGTGGGTVNVPTAKTKMYFVFNNTASAITFKVTGQTGVSIPAAAKMALVSNGTDIIVAQNYFAALTLGAALPVASGGTGLTAGTSGGVLAFTATGTLASSAALAASALVIGGGAGAAPSTTATGTGVVTALGVNTGSAGAFVVNGGALGSPSTAGTMPAFTLGGTVSGGGNQINNVVIGTTTPLAGAFTTLSAGNTTLTGTTALTVNRSGAQSQITLQNNGTSTGILIAGATNGLAFYDAAAGQPMGTWAYAAGLAVTGTLSATGTLSGGTSGTAYSFSGSAPATSLTLDTSGNLGIGTTSPAAKLEIKGDSNEKFILNATLDTNSYQNQITFQNAGTTYAAIIAGKNASNVSVGLVFNTGTTEKMRIDSSGIVTMSAYGAGAATFSAAGVISSVSDETWKIKDGVPVDTDAMLKKLEPGYWYYNDEKKETFGSDRQLGFYAQNVNAAIGPEAAPTPEEGKPWGYYDRSVLAITVMSLQKALATIETLTARVAQLESKP